MVFDVCQTASSNNSSSSWSECYEAMTGQFRVLQPIWDLRLGHEDAVSSPLFPIVTSLIFYVLCMLPFTVFDFYGKQWHWIQKYKIQTDREVTWSQAYRGFRLTAWNHLLYILPVSLGQWTWTPASPLPLLAPPLWEFFWQQLCSLLIFDLEYYIWHFVHHKVRFLYRHIHSVHHHFSSPSSWTSEYLHPWELISIGIFSTTSPWLFDSHPMTQCSFILLSIAVSVDDHCGYDLPLLPQHWAPFWGGSIHHDMHHQKPLTNFQPFFTMYDQLFGSFCPGQRAGGYKPKSLIEWEKVPHEEELDFGMADTPKVKDRKIN